MINAEHSRHNRLADFRNRVMLVVCTTCAGIIVALLIVITLYLVIKGVRYLSWDMFTKEPIAIGMAGAPGGMKNGIIGTLILIGLSSMIGVPMGMLTGVYLSEYDTTSWMTAPVRFISDVLAGVPSIVVGILGYELLVAPAAAGYFKFIPYFNDIHGNNGWAGAAALAFIMIPIVSRTTEEMLRLVPHSYREASIALGATKAKTILQVVIPSATGSIVTGVMLAVARVAGETAPLLFTAMGSRFVETDPRNPFPSLTVQIYDYATGVFPEQQKLAWAGILVLVALIFVLNLTVRYFTRRFQAI